MTIEIHDQMVQKWIEQEIAAGGYPSTEALVADAVHALKIERELLAEQHDDATIRLLAADPGALDHRSRDGVEVFAELRKLNELASAHPAATP